jgi:hypothetical protein
MSETPRTDEMREAYVNFQHGKYTVDVGDVFDFARKLERELADAREQCCQAINEYETALRNIMQNEKAMHRMDYNPYLIASAALKGGQNE